jgi:hypothetical protein
MPRLERLIAASTLACPWLSKSERVQRVFDRINQEMRSIFGTAKSRHLEQRVD